jgi:hypothetical protein
LDVADAAAVTHVEQDEIAKAVAGLVRHFTAHVRVSGVIEIGLAPHRHRTCTLATVYGSISTI